MPHATINAASLWYEERGHGEPLLFHHGYTGTRENWEPAARLLEDRYRVILMECRGAGESEHTAEGYTLEQYAADVIGLADHLGLERFTYAGHSMGGGVGYVLALEYPARLERLVLMASIPADGATGDPRWRQEARRRRAERDVEAMRRRFEAMRFRPEVETDAFFAGRIEQSLGVSDGHFEGGSQTMAALRVADRLGELTLPTLVIAGAVDGLLQANLRDFLALPNATLQVFARAGHEVAVHEPEGVARAIAEFVQHGVITSRTLLERVEAAGVR